MAKRPTFYIDRCLGKAVATALRDAGATDEAWIPDVAGRGWIILTKDKNIRRRPGEREAILLGSARVFTLCSGNMRGAEMAALFVAVVGHDGIEIVYPLPTPE